MTSKRLAGQHPRGLGHRVGAVILIALSMLCAAFVPTPPADAATRVGIGEPRILSTKAGSGDVRATLGVRVRSNQNVQQVRIYLFTTRTHVKKTVVAHLSTGTKHYGYWKGEAAFTELEGGTWRTGKVRVLGSRDRLLRSKAMAKNTAAVLAVFQRDEFALVMNGRTQGPSDARTTKFALRMVSNPDEYEYRNAPVRLTAFFLRPSGKTFRRSFETRTNENGKCAVTFGAYHMARVKALAIDLPNDDGPSLNIYFDF